MKLALSDIITFGCMVTKKFCNDSPFYKVSIALLLLFLSACNETETEIVSSTLEITPRQEWKNPSRIVVSNSLDRSYEKNEQGEIQEEKGYIDILSFASEFYFIHPELLEPDNRISRLEVSSICHKRALDEGLHSIQAHNEPDLWQEFYSDTVILEHHIGRTYSVFHLFPLDFFKLHYIFELNSENEAVFYLTCTFDIIAYNNEEMSQHYALGFRDRTTFFEYEIREEKQNQRQIDGQIEENALDPGETPYDLFLSCEDFDLTLPISPELAEKLGRTPYHYVLRSNLEALAEKNKLKILSHPNFDPSNFVQNCHFSVTNNEGLIILTEEVGQVAFPYNEMFIKYLRTSRSRVGINGESLEMQWRNQMLSLDNNLILFHIVNTARSPQRMFCRNIDDVSEFMGLAKQAIVKDYFTNAIIENSTQTIGDDMVITLPPRSISTVSLSSYDTSIGVLYTLRCKYLDRDAQTLTNEQQHYPSMQNIQAISRSRSELRPLLIGQPYPLPQYDW